ncbi:response regulator [Rhodobacter sp. SGA-6-6]|uniref:response regulator n=1 Tax=Rhodobacter sp. SGA-6-6 TaxID=2710882 RepID=UPI0013EB0FD3|nr:response regulator [Rhodobacter sp. SGA-6-6]NGM45234.1 response regulator [Rhodobacter sp. SGA-6-6]
MPAIPDPVILPPPLPRGTGLPLQGVTLLAVEDSRLACDALRLFCQRSGARLRRAATLEEADAHLRVYRPDAVLVDLGLPDGRGEGLIRTLAAGPGRPGLLAMSGDPDGRAAALAAGADAFLEKPLPGLAVFQRTILPLLPGRPAVGLPEDGTVSADPAALHDDLARAAQAVQAGPEAEERRYLAGFLTGLARQTRDAALSEATAALRTPGEGLHRLARLLDERLTDSAPFRPGAP